MIKQHSSDDRMHYFRYDSLCIEAKATALVGEGKE